MILTIVTGNTKKFHEMQHALEPFGIEVQRANIDLPELQSMDHVEVIRAKTLAAFSELHAPVLVDDSGFYVDRYNQFPGVLSKYVYAMIGYAGLFALLTEGEAAQFRCFVGYIDADMVEPQIFTGQYHGTVTTQFDPATTEYGEMPYVPLFVPTEQPNPQSPVPLAQLTPQQRTNDHRHQALQAFARWYQSRYNTRTD